MLRAKIVKNLGSSISLNLDQESFEVKENDGAVHFWKFWPLGGQKAKITLFEGQNYQKLDSLIFSAQKICCGKPMAVHLEDITIIYWSESSFCFTDNDVSKIA